MSPLGWMITFWIVVILAIGVIAFFKWMNNTIVDAVRGRDRELFWGPEK